MATTKDKAPETVEAAVLRDCGFGSAGDVVTLSSADAQAGSSQGALDLHPEAVKAAKLPK